MFQASSVPIIRSYLLYAWQLVRWNFQFQPVSAWKRSHSLHETYQLPCVRQITPDDGHRRCPKHVEFCDKINVRYLMHLVGCFIQRNLLLLLVMVQYDHKNISYIVSMFRVLARNHFPLLLNSVTTQNLSVTVAFSLSILKLNHQDPTYITSE